MPFQSRTRRQPCAKTWSGCGASGTTARPAETGTQFIGTSMRCTTWWRGTANFSSMTTRLTLPAPPPSPARTRFPAVSGGTPGCSALARTARTLPVSAAGAKFGPMRQKCRLVSLAPADRFPEQLIVLRRVGESFTDEKFAMHGDDQHLLVIGSVEDADPVRATRVFTHKASSIREATVRGPHRGDGMSPVSNGNNVPGGGILGPLHRRSSPHLRPIDVHSRAVYLLSRRTSPGGVGPFTQVRAMAGCELPSACPECGARAPCPPDRTRLPHRVGGRASGRRKVRAQRRRIARPAAILARSCWNDPGEVETCPEAETCTGESLSVASSLNSKFLFRCPVGRGYYPARLRTGGKSGAFARWKQS